MTLFYVYEHWRPDTGECFYVGKGCKQRARDMNRDRSNQHVGIIKDLEAMGLCIEIRLFMGGLTEGEAFAQEKARIEDLRAAGAPLVNIVGTEEFKARCGSPGEKHPLWGKRHSPETRAKQSEAAKRRPRRTLSSEHKEKIRAATFARPDFRENLEKMWAAKPSPKKDMH